MNSIDDFAEMRRLRRLVDAVLDDIASDDEVRELDALLMTDAAARQYYRSASNLNADLRWMHRADSDHQDTDIKRQGGINNRANVRVTTRGRVWNAQSLPKVSRSERWSLPRTHRLAVAAMVCAVIATFAVTLFQQGAIRSRLVVAELRSEENCTWGASPAALAVGDRLHAGQLLQLEEGVAQLHFRGGATVLVEGPTRFELLSVSSMRLERGTVAVRANGPVKDFVVISPDASITDLGTSFGVHCDGNGATHVEVFEGAVEVVPQTGPKKEQVLGLGASTQFGSRDGENVVSFDDEQRFAELLRRLWENIRSQTPDRTDQSDSSVVVIDFNDAPVPGAVDTYYGSVPGRGWLTPWVASGNPSGEIRRDDSAFELGNPFLQMRFDRSYGRAIGREYGGRNEFDPNQPHLITWLWRMEGNPKHFGGKFKDRVGFYANPFFRRNSWPTNSWLIGVVGGDEAMVERGRSTDWLKRKHRSDEFVEFGDGPRQVFPMRWYFFDANDEGPAGAVFDKRNMIDTGMELKFGVVYRFAVAVYPEMRRYDAAIRDDQRTFVRTGMSFRSREGISGNVLHFAVSVSHSSDDASFSLDSLQIEPLSEVGVEQQIEMDSSNVGKRLGPAD